MKILLLAGAASLALALAAAGQAPTVLGGDLRWTEGVYIDSPK